MQTQNRNEHLTDAQILRGWLDTIPHGEYNKRKKQLVEACAVSLATLHNWLYGQSRITKAGKRDINKFALEVSGHEIFPVAKPGESREGVSAVISGEAI